MRTITRYTPWIALAAVASAEAAAVVRSDTLPWWLVTAWQLWWWLSLAGLWSITRRVARPAVRIVCLVGLGAAFVVYALSWASYLRSWRFLSIDTLLFGAGNARQMFQYIEQMEPIGVRVFAVSLLAALAFGAWSAGRPLAPRSAQARRRGRMIWYAATVLLQVLLFLVPRDPSMLRRRERLFALSHELNPAATLVATGLQALTEERIGPTLDAGRLTPLAAGWQARAGPARRSILLVAVESLRSDVVGLVHQGHEVMPRLAALGRDGIVFTRAYAQSTHSNYSDPTVLSSLHPLRTRVTHLYRRDDPWPKTLLYDLLRPQGYRTAMFSSQNESWGRMDTFYASPALERFVDAERSGLPTYVSRRDTGFAGEVRLGTLRAGNLDDRVTTDLALEWLASLARQEPFLLVVTYQNSHFPYEIAPEEPRPFSPGVIDFDAMFGNYDIRHVPVVRNAYYNSLQASDRQLGRLLDALRELGRSDDTIVVVYGENGECFHENGCINHAGAPWEPAVHVACVLRAPGLAPRSDDYPFALIDIAPTLLGRLGDPPHPGFQGIDALDPERPDADRRRVFFHAQTVRTDGLVAGGRYKYVMDRKRDRESVYDLARDPGEQRDLAADQPHLTAQLRDVFARWRRDQLAYYQFESYYRVYYPPSDWGEGPAIAP